MDHSASAARSRHDAAIVQFPHQPALQLIYDTAPIGLACLSPDCRYLRINQHLTEICGISVEDHLGRFVRDCVPALADSVEQIVRSIVETGEPVIGVEVAGQRKDQPEDRFWITYWHPLRAAGGEIVAVNVAAEEITERKRAEQEMARAKDAAETALRHLRETQESLIEAEKLAALGRMVAGVAHEINSPVGSGLTVASSLQRKAELFAAEAARGHLKRSSLNEFVDLIQQASSQLVSNLNRAAERVQSFKQVALDQSQPHRRSFDASEMTEQVLSHLGRELRNRGIALKLRLEPALELDSFPGAFGQVLVNLVTNSLIHAFPDNRKGGIDIRLRPADADHIELLLADDGCGMTPEVKRQAFDPFFTTRRHQGATGLGLHIVHTIVTEKLGGRLKLTSEPGAGTSVQLVLPKVAPRAG
ncbi:PAS domain-containing protein [Bradyrhizobium lablabi]|uniref:ATP-binding protein n=1 Tax=Bradyrhizobium lablabi TaxID=722472 RepID=UPI001BA9C2DF|nr:ATP-binding protein [Bradyrhizobium lablabi]MBR1124214.1 PAS domain-containing protein [Bradyrhizobium lablabi]